MCVNTRMSWKKKIMYENLMVIPTLGIVTWTKTPPVRKYEIR